MLFSCNKKDKYPEMKIGYYNVIDERVYPNGDTDTLYYISLGPIMYGDDWRSLVFTRDSNGAQISDRFDLSVSSLSKNNLVYSGYINFIITNSSSSSTELIVFRESNNAWGYKNKIK